MNPAQTAAAAAPTGRKQGSAPTRRRGTRTGADRGVKLYAQQPPPPRLGLKDGAGRHVTLRVGRARADGTGRNGGREEV